MSTRHSVIAAVGLVLFLPSLWAGFLLDDFYYLGAIEGRFPEHNTRRSLFTFFINDEEATRDIAREGGYPWWIDERVRGETFRPLSDLLLRGDHSLHGRAAVGYHLHSLVWWGAALLACCLLFRRVLPGSIGTLAFLLFAIDDVHVMPVTWIANRNALVAVAPVLFGLWAWIRWCEDNWRPGRVLALLGIVIGLAGGELALAATAYVVAYTLIGAPANGFRERLVRVAPVAGLGFAYALVYDLLGFSSSNSGIYQHPLHETAEFVTAIAAGAPVLLASGIAGFSADFWIAAPALHPVLIITGCVVTAGFLVLLRACWPRLDDRSRRGLGWLLAGSALSLIPVGAVFPSDRMLLVPGIGITAAVAAVIVTAWRSWRGVRRLPLIVAAGFLSAVHLLFAPVLAVGIQSLMIKHGRRSLELAASPVVREAGGREAVLIFAPDPVVSVYLPLLIDYVDGPAPAGWRPLSIAPFDHRLRRTGPRTLELQVAGKGVMMRGLFETLYRDPKNRLTPGDVVDRGILQAEVLAGNDRGLTRVAFHFDRDLTDPALYFLVWQEGELRVATLPEIGEEVLLRRSPGPGGF